MRVLSSSKAVWVIGVLFVAAGTLHFIQPEPYLAMMPSWLPAPGVLVVVSGVAEILGGLGLLLERFRRAAAWGLIALLVAVFPANLHVALHGWPGTSFPSWVLWLRLPLQPVMIWVVYRLGVRSTPKPFCFTEGNEANEERP